MDQSKLTKCKNRLFECSTHEDRTKLLFTWVKQGHITNKEHTALFNHISDERPAPRWPQDY